MKNVLILDLHCDALLPAGAGEFGGGNVYSKALLQLLIDTKFNILYITRKKIETLKDVELFSSNIKYYRIPIGKYDVNDKDTIHLHSDSTYDTIVTLMNKLSFFPSLIHSIYWPSGIVAQLLSAKYNIPYIHTVLSNGIRKQLESGKYELAYTRIKYEQECFNNASYIICSSLAESDDIEKLYNIPKSKLILAGQQIASAFQYPDYYKSGKYQIEQINIDNKQSPIYIELESSSDSTVSLWWNKGSFLYFGRLHEDKGLLHIIAVWLSLYSFYNDFPSLWIAGGTPQQIAVFRKKILNQNSLERAENAQKLVWWGRLSSKGLSTLLLKTNLVITHSKYESGGIMVLEAMAQGIPIIATPYGYAKHCITDWVNGFLVDYGDEELLKLRMIQIYYQPFWTAIMGLNAKKQFSIIQKEFNFEQKHLDLYDGSYSAYNYSCNMLPMACNNLPYPLTEYIPSDSEIINYFMQQVRSTELISSHKRASIYKTIHTNEYSIWKINYNEKNYECFRWKNHINKNRYFQDDEYFYLSRKLYSCNHALCKEKLVATPIFVNKQYFLIFHKEYNKQETDINNLILQIIKIWDSSFSSDTTITFQNYTNKNNQILTEFESYIWLAHEIKDCINSAISLYNDSETFGITPSIIMPYMISGNKLCYIGSFHYGPLSYAIAWLVFSHNYDWDYFMSNIVENIKLKLSDLLKNIILWLINLHITKYINDSIYFKKCDSDIMEKINYYLDLSKKYV